MNKNLGKFHSLIYRTFFSIFNTLYLDLMVGKKIQNVNQIPSLTVLHWFVGLKELSLNSSTLEKEGKLTLMFSSFLGILSFFLECYYFLEWFSLFCGSHFLVGECLNCCPTLG